MRVGFAAFLVFLGCSRTDGDGDAADASAGGPGDPNTSEIVSGSVTSEIFASEGDTTSSLVFAPPATPVVGFEYEVNGDDKWQPLGPDRVVAGLSNGTSYTFRVRVVNADGPSLTPSAPSNQVVPYGVPEPPKVEGTATSGTTTWTWSPRKDNGRAIVGYQHKLDDGSFSETAPEKTFSQALAAGMHTLCVRAVTKGAPDRNVSAEECLAVSSSGALPTTKAERDADAFGAAVAGDPKFAREIKANQTYSINAACFTKNDIGSNNGWWYRNAATNHWVAGTNFVDETNKFGAPRVNGGNGCN